MTAVYPNSVRNYTAQQDLVNTVIADNVNSLQEEVKKIEEVLGSAATSQNPLVSTWSGSFSQGTTWGTLYDRLANIEAGIISGTATGPYVSKSGGSTVSVSTVTGAPGLTLTTSSGTNNLLTAAAFTLNYLGIPQVSGANVIYVGSSDHVALTNATSSASTSAAAKVPLSTVTTAGDLIIGSGNATVSRLGIGSSGSALVSNGTTAAWATPTDTSKIPLATVTTAGDLILGSGSAAVTRLAIGGSGTVLTSNGTTATWVAPSSSFVSQTNGVVTTAAIASGVVRNVWTSTSVPTSGQGAIGDIWVVYT